jgi:GntR family transcriptional regulator
VNSISPPADRVVAAQLEIPTGVPVLLMQRYSYAGHQRVEYVVSSYRADRYQLWVPLGPPKAAYRVPRGGSDRR